MGNSVEIQFRENGSISPVLEDYVKTIAFLKKEKRYARISDIAKSLEVKSPTANVAINSLCAIGLVIHDKYGYVDLTDKGEEIAKEVQNKHDVLFRFLREILSVSPATALKEACGIEHHVSSETIDRLEKLHRFLSKTGEIQKLKEYMSK